jgi:antirestriction protein ArdC
MKGVNSKNIAKVITDKVIEGLRNNPGKWIKSWTSSSRPRNLFTGHEYNGCNWLWLSMVQGGKDVGDSNKWLTYNQAKQMTGLEKPIKRGSKGQPIILYKPLKVTEQVGDALKEKMVPIMRVFTVFNRDVVEGLPKEIIPEDNEENKLEEVEGVIRNHKIDVKNGYDGACFIPSQDVIHMPKIVDFKSTEDYYATLLHEMTHWTGHKSRLDRDMSTAFGGSSYAFEELVAELGSAMLCNNFNIEGDLQHTEYIASWLKALEDDEKLILKASAKAQKAFDYLLGDGNESRGLRNNSESTSSTQRQTV